MGKNTMAAIIVVLLVLGGLGFLMMQRSRTVPQQETIIEEETSDIEDADEVEDADEEEAEDVMLDPINATMYDQSGTATLTETADGVEVMLTLDTLAMLSDPQPAHIHAGDCPGVGEVRYPLNPVVDGKSVTVLDTTMDDLESLLPLAINVHKSQAEISVYTSCGSLEL